MKIHNANKFEEGDIIIKDGYTYVCRIVGKKEAYFEHRWFKGLCNNPPNTLGMPYGTKWPKEANVASSLILSADKGYYLIPEKDKTEDIRGPVFMYPIIGTTDKHGFHIEINMTYLSRVYPDYYREYLKSLQEELDSK